MLSKGYNDYAAFCIMAGMILDFSDGFAARLLKAYSDIGKDLDSLADVVTFGIAPGAIVLNLLLFGRNGGLLPAFAIAASYLQPQPCGLAKFNNDTTQSHLLQGAWPLRQAHSSVVSCGHCLGIHRLSRYLTLWPAQPWFIGAAFALPCGDDADQHPDVLAEVHSASDGGVMKRGGSLQESACSAVADLPGWPRCR
ncbi:MAG: CDP-alcohol phosphatidyltransferase family protein [Marinilabiliales bacterium]|nr:CDP-alcohol phosphatidyltransferase family protein [Marinilabiliales bacterium]